MSTKFTNRRERVWAQAAEGHKMGWLDEGVELNVIDEYQGFSQFDRAVGLNPELKPWTEGYKQYWITSDALSSSRPEPDEEPDEEPTDEPWPPPEDINVADAQLGHAVRLILEEGGSVTFPAPIL